MVNFSIINVIIASFFAFILGELWYSSAFLGNKYLFLLNKTKMNLKNPTILWISQLFAALTSASAIEYLRVILNMHHFLGSLLIGGVIGLVLIVPNMVNDAIRLDQSMKVVAINSFFRIIQFLVIGGLLGGLGH